MKFIYLIIIDIFGINFFYFLFVNGYDEIYLYIIENCLFNL